MSQMLRELEGGGLSAEQAMRLRDKGGLDPIRLFVDAMSVHAAVTSTVVKIPAENSLLCLAQSLLEMLVRKTLSSFIWIDARNMVFDGHAKGRFTRRLT